MAEATSTPWKTIALWTVTGVVSAIFLMTGGAKLSGAELLAQGYAEWGLPEALLYVVGAVEVIGALLLLVPRVSTIGASVLAVVMTGAVALHLAHGEAGAVVVPAALLGLSALVGWVRRCSTLALLRPALPALPRVSCPD